MTIRPPERPDSNQPPLPPAGPANELLQTLHEQMLRQALAERMAPLVEQEADQIFAANFADATTGPTETGAGQPPAGTAAANEALNATSGLIGPGDIIHFPFGRPDAMQELPIRDQRGRLLPGITLRMVPVFAADDGSMQAGGDDLFVVNPYEQRVSDWATHVESDGPISPSVCRSANPTFVGLTTAKTILSNEPSPDFPLLFTDNDGAAGSSVVDIVLDGNNGNYVCGTDTPTPENTLRIARLAVRNNVLAIHVPDGDAGPAFQGLQVVSAVDTMHPENLSPGVIDISRRMMTPGIVQPSNTPATPGAGEAVTNDQGTGTPDLSNVLPPPQKYDSSAMRALGG